MIVFLDSGILGLISSPNERAEVTACQNWMMGLMAKGVYVVSSDICDYEIRRSLLLLEAQKLTQVSLMRLEHWGYSLSYFTTFTHSFSLVTPLLERLPGSSVKCSKSSRFDR